MFFDKEMDEINETFEPVEEEVMFADSEAEEVFSENKFVSGTVIGGSLNLRVAPEKTAIVIDVLPEGSKVEATVTELGKEWANVSANGLGGFVMSKYIKWNEE